jgi:Flp pilus assembly protein TadG
MSITRSIIRSAAGKRRRDRRGAAAVEFALVAPLLFMLVLGMMELGRMLMVQQILTNGAREGARRAVLPGVTDAEVQAAIDSYMSNTGISGHTRLVSPSCTNAEAGTPLEITVSLPYSNVSWLPLGTLRWLQGKTLTASVEMRKEEY